LRETDGGNTEPRPQAYLTLTRVDLPCLVRNPAKYSAHHPPEPQKM